MILSDTMTDYQQGKIYAIRSSSTDKYYIGSTATTLCKRLYQHKNKKNTSSAEITAFGDAYIELIELFPCGSKIELNKREGELQREMKASIVNKYFAHTSPEQRKEQQAEYYAEHVEENRAIKAEYRAEHKEEQAEYRAEHKEEIKEKQAEYRTKHKEEIKEKKSVNHDCECGGKYTHGHKSRHIKSKLHQTYLAQ